MGSTTGTRVPMRTTSTDGTVRRAASTCSRCSVAIVKRVAARDDHVVDFRVLVQVGDDLLQACHGDGRLAVPGHPLAGAVPAIAGAGRGDQQQCAVRVAVNQPGHGHVLVFLQRVVAQGGIVHQLVELGHAHGIDRVARVWLADERGVIRRDGQGEPARRGQRPSRQGACGSRLASPPRCGRGCASASASQTIDLPRWVSSRWRPRMPPCRSPRRPVRRVSAEVRRQKRRTPQLWEPVPISSKPLLKYRQKPERPTRPLNPVGVPHKTPCNPSQNLCRGPKPNLGRPLRQAGLRVRVADAATVYPTL